MAGKGKKSGKRAPVKRKAAPKGPSLAPSSLQKQFQEIASVYGMIQVWNQKSMTKASQQNVIYNNYHGIGAGKVAAILQVLQGEGRFSILWQNTVFGDTKELSFILPGNCSDNKNNQRYSLKNFTVESLGRATAKSKKLIQGRGLVNKANKCLKNMKKMYACYSSHLINGELLPSGLNEEDMLKLVLKDLYLHARTKGSNDDSSEDEEEEEEEGDSGDEESEEELEAGAKRTDKTAPTTKSFAKDSSSRRKKNNDSDSEADDDSEYHSANEEDPGEEEEEYEEDEGMDPATDGVIGTEDDIEVPPYFLPASFWAFIVYGPFNPEGVHAIIMADDVSAKDAETGEKGNRAKKRELESQDAAIERISQPNRGISDFHLHRIESDAMRNRIQKFESVKQGIVDARDGYHAMFEMHQQMAATWQRADKPDFASACMLQMQESMMLFQRENQRLEMWINHPSNSDIVNFTLTPLPIASRNSSGVSPLLLPPTSSATTPTASFSNTSSNRITSLMRTPGTSSEGITFVGESSSSSSSSSRRTLPRVLSLEETKRSEEAEVGATQSKKNTPKPSSNNKGAAPKVLNNSSSNSSNSNSGNNNKK